MQQNFGVLIVLFALIISFAIFSTTKLLEKKRKSKDLIEEENNPDLEQVKTLYDDDIIAIRKVEREEKTDKVLDQSSPNNSNRAVYVLHVMAQENKLFKGYELLQALLSQGLRFGEMNIFHRHQQLNGKGTVLFSLTSAVEPGTFDIHNMGRCACPGLTLFMASSGNSEVDIDRFNLMLKTAKNIARELEGTCQNEERQMINEALIESYRHNIYNNAIPAEIKTHTGELSQQY